MIFKVCLASSIIKISNFGWSVYGGLRGHPPISFSYSLWTILESGFTVAFSAFYRFFCSFSIFKLELFFFWTLSDTVLLDFLSETNRERTFFQDISNGKYIITQHLFQVETWLLWTLWLSDDNWRLNRPFLSAVRCQKARSKSLFFLLDSFI